MYYKIHYSKGMSFFGEKAGEILGLEKYNPKKDLRKPVLFLSLYFPEDYKVLEEHKGKKAIFWNGGDVKILANNAIYQQTIKSFPRVTHACHSALLQEELWNMGINAKIRPIFFGKKEDYPVSYKHKTKPEVYLVAHPGRLMEYGIDIIERIAPQFPDIKFHVYGVKGKDTENISFRGQVEEEVMDKEIKNFQGCLRLNNHDGLSQSVIKSVLLGQHPITTINHPEIINAPSEESLSKQLSLLAKKKSPNLKAREYYWTRLNNFDWLAPEKDGISLVMIVKNEEKGIEKAILSCKDFVDQIVISVDAKSTDKTVEIAGKYADILLSHEWKDDFSLARNSAQSHATRKWALILDGHEYVESAPDMKKMLKSEVEGIFVKVRLEKGFSLYSPRLIKSWVPWVNPVHNYPSFTSGGKCKDFLIVHDRAKGQTEEGTKARTAQRTEMNFRILKERIRKNKKDMRSHFYLGQQYISAKKWRKAIPCFEKYLKQSNNKQERWIALYEMSRCANCLNRPKLAIKFLQRADKEMPKRWEIPKNIGSCYMLLGKPREALPFLVESFSVNVADFVFEPERRNDPQTWYFIGQCFYALKEFKKAKVALVRALKGHKKKGKGSLPEQQVKIIKAILKTL